MKTNLKFKKCILLVVQHPVVSAILVIFFLTVLLIFALVVFHPKDYYLIISKIAGWSFGIIAALSLAHFLITKMFITRFSPKKNRIQLIYYDDDNPQIYQEPILKKVPYTEVIFPDNWNLSHPFGQYIAPLFLGVKTSNHVTFHLFFELRMEIAGSFLANDLERLIASQKKRFPKQKKFEFISCLEDDFLIKGYCANLASLKLLLEEYHLKELSFHDLRLSILGMTNILNFFSNVNKLELRLTEVCRVVKLSSPLVSLNKAAAVL